MNHRLKKGLKSDRKLHRSNNKSKYRHPQQKQQGSEINRKIWEKIDTQQYIQNQSQRELLEGEIIQFLKKKKIIPLILQELQNEIFISRKKKFSIIMMKKRFHLISINLWKITINFNMRIYHKVQRISKVIPHFFQTQLKKRITNSLLKFRRQPKEKQLK